MIWMKFYRTSHLSFVSCSSADNNGSVESLNVKEWQDGLRALLPNININFGGLPNSTSSSSSSSTSSVNHIGVPIGSAGISHSLSWDSTASWMDPAIITGEIVDYFLQLCVRNRTVAGSHSSLFKPQVSLQTQATIWTVFRMTIRHTGSSPCRHSQRWTDRPAPAPCHSPLTPACWTRRPTSPYTEPRGPRTSPLPR